jgi:hypothetical protein
MKKSSIRQARYFRSTGLKVVMALALASAISSLSISPALADNNDNNDGHGRGNRHGHQGQREWRGDREGYDGYYRREYQGPYIYAQPVYVPPPVYYEPRPSVGISLFFPLDLR